MIRTNIEEIYNTNEEPDKVDFNNGRNKIYFSRRKELKKIITKINTYINNSSQSVFLALYFMDTIFTSYNLEKIFFSHFNSWEYLIPLKDIQMNNYALLSLACLIIAYKYGENDPRIQSMSSFVKLLYHFSKKTMIFSSKDLAMAEVIAVKLLKYKLNYYTIYHFFVFFFTHGIIFKNTFQNSVLFCSMTERKFLEKIYIQAREILDWIIDSEEYFNYYYGKDNHIIVAEIILWTIEYILGEKIHNDENIFKIVYDIKISEEKHSKIYEMINKLFTSKKIYKENIDHHQMYMNKNYYNNLPNFNNISSYITITDINNLKAKKNHSYNNSIKKNNSNSNSNYNLFNTYNNLESYDNIYNYNAIFPIEPDQYDSNYSYQYTVPNKSVSLARQQEIPIPKSVGLKNKSFYNSNKNITTNYDISQVCPTDSNIFPSNRRNGEFFKRENKTDRERVPTDRIKIKNNLNDDNKIYEIDFDEINRKKILLNTSKKINKKSLSYSKNINSSISKNNSTCNSNYDYHIKSSYLDPPNNIFDLINEDELKFDEKINKPKNFINKKNINNYLYSVSPNQTLPGKYINKNGKLTLYKKYQKSSNEYISRINKNNNTHKNLPTSKIISNIDLANKTKNLYSVTKINQTVENEPRDNIKRSIKKIKKKNDVNTNNLNNINSINKNNKLNTIIINNNIHINTFIDNNKPINPTIDKKNSKIIMLNKIIDNNINEILTLPNLNNRYSNINTNKQKLIYDSKNSQNIINKSSTITNEYNNINGFKFLNKNF